MDEKFFEQIRTMTPSKLREESYLQTLCQQVETDALFFAANKILAAKRQKLHEEGISEWRKDTSLPQMLTTQLGFGPFSGLWYEVYLYVSNEDDVQHPDEAWVAYLPIEGDGLYVVMPTYRNGKFLLDVMSCHFWQRFALRAPRVKGDRPFTRKLIWEKIPSLESVSEQKYWEVVGRNQHLLAPVLDAFMLHYREQLNDYVEGAQSERLREDGAPTPYVTIFSNGTISYTIPFLEYRILLHKTFVAELDGVQMSVTEMYRKNFHALMEYAKRDCDDI